MTVVRAPQLLALHVLFVIAILVAGIATGRADPAQYRAVTLLCPPGLPAADCNRSSALDILAVVPVPTPFACMMGGMSAAACMHELANAGYPKIFCEVR